MLLLLPSHITIHHCNTLSPATVLPYQNKRNLIIILLQLKEFSVPHSGLLETPIDNYDLLLFVEGSYLKTEIEGYRKGYTITNLNSPLE